MKINHLGRKIYLFPGQHWLFLGLFKSRGKNVLINVFAKKITKICYILGENARYKCFKSKYRQFPANFGQMFAFSTPGISLMTKDLAQIKVYTHLFQYRKF